MRIDNVNFNNNSVQRSNANPHFKSNVFVETVHYCKRGRDFCSSTLKQIEQNSVASAKATAKFGGFGKLFWVFEDGQRTGCLVIDKTTPEYSDFSSLSIDSTVGVGDNSVTAFIKNVLAATGTIKVKLPSGSNIKCQSCVTATKNGSKRLQLISSTLN